jgi:hypothetical protein
MRMTIEKVSPIRSLPLRCCLATDFCSNKGDHRFIYQSVTFAKCFRTQHSGSPRVSGL